MLPGTVALVLAVRALPRPTVDRQAAFDTPGAILSALLLGSTIMAANSMQSASQHIDSLYWTLLAAISGTAFIWRIRQTDNPLLPPAMFKNERFTLSAFTSLIAFVSGGSLLLPCRSCSRTSMAIARCSRRCCLLRGH